MKKRDTQDNKVIAAITAIVIFLMAVIKSPSCNDQGLTIRHLIWSVGMFLPLVLLFWRRRIAIDKTLLLFMFGWLFFVVLSGLHAVNSAEWLYETAKACLVIITLIVLINILDEPVLCRLMIVLVVGLSIYGLIAGWGHYPTFSGLGGNRNPWSATLMLLIPFCFNFWPAAILPLVNIALLGTRSVILAAFAVCMFNKNLRYLIIVIALVLAATSWRKIAKTGSVYDRVEQYKATAMMIKDNPFGVGAGNWKIKIPQYSRFFRDDRQFGSIITTRCHNDYLQSAAEVGVAGMLLWLCVLGYSLKCARHNKTAAAGIAGYMIFAFFSFPAERPFHSFIIIVFLALACRGNLKVIRFRKGYFRISLIILCFCSVDFYFRHRANIQSIEIRKAASATDLENAVHYISPLANLDPGNTMPLHTYRAIANAGLKKTGRAIDDAQKAVKNHPNSAMALIVLGGLYINAGRMTDAKYNVARAEEIRPGIKTELEKRKRWRHKTQ